MPETFSSRIQAAAAPYSHMSDEDAELFYSSLNTLLVYANERLRVVEPWLLRPRPGLHMLYEHGALVSDALWRNREIIDDFVRENPCRLTEHQLEVVRPWRYAVRDLFVCLAADKDRAVYMNGERLFVMGAAQDDADAHVHGIPSLMLLALLPFKGGIVTDGKTVHIEQRPSLWCVPLVSWHATGLAQHEPIATADQLVAYSRARDARTPADSLVQRSIDEYLTVLLAQAERENP